MYRMPMARGVIKPMLVMMALSAAVTGSTRPLELPGSPSRDREAPALVLSEPELYSRLKLTHLLYFGGWQ